MKKTQFGLLALGMAALNAQAAVVITPTTLTTTEDESPIQYQIVLDSPPDVTEQVTVTPSSEDMTEGTVSGPIAFTAANWDIPQLVTLTPGASGDGNDGDVMFNITHSVSVTNPSLYADGAASSIGVTNQNIEGIASISVTPSSGASLFISEAGPGTVVTIAALGSPTQDITIDLSSSDTSRATLSAASVTLTAGNSYSTTVTVQPVDDTADDGDQPFTITTDAAVSADLSYSGVNPMDIMGISVDNDTAAIDVSPSSGISVTEGGASQSVTIAASGAVPTADVTIDLTPTAEVTTSVASVTLTAGNGYSATFDITAVDDAAVDGDLAFTVTTDPAVSADGAFSGLDSDDATGTAVDNDTPAPAVGSAAPLPTIGHFGQFILMMLIAGFGLRSLRQRK